MDNQEFIDKCKQLVSEYTNNHVDKSDNITVPPQDVFVVCFILADFVRKL